MAFRVVDECLVVPRSAPRGDTAIQKSLGGRRDGDESSSSVGAGLSDGRVPAQLETWECTSIDVMTLENGFALNTCWLFDRSIPEAHIKTSLSVLLDEYRPFAGRYDWLHKRIVLNDHGVKFQLCEDDEYDLERARSEHFRGETSTRFIDESSRVLGYIFANHPLMTVRLTYLHNGGCALGVFVSHGLADGDTFYSMMDRWATLARGSLDGPKVVFDQSQVPFSRTRRCAQDVRQELEENGYGIVQHHSAAIRLGMLMTEGIWFHNKLRSKPYHLSSDGLARLKLAAELDCKTSGRRLASNITSNEALSAFLSQMMARLFDFADHEPCAHATMYNWRGRLDGLSPHFAGNASSAIESAKFFAGSTLGEIVWKMNYGFETYKSDRAEIRNHVELCFDSFQNGIASHMAEPRTLPYLNSTPTTTVTNNFARYPIYGVDFGYGGPVQVIPHFCGDQVMIWPSASGDGVDLYFQGSTAAKLQSLLPEDEKWFESELMKFETELTKERIQAWFECQVSDMKNSDATKNSIPTVFPPMPSPISVSRRRVGEKKDGLSAIRTGFLHPLMALLKI